MQTTKQTAPRFSFPGLEDQVLVYESLGLVHQHFSNMARIVNTGNAFLILEVENGNILKDLIPDRHLIAKLCAKYGLTGFCIFSLPKFAQRIDATSRMFAATYSIDKEWATIIAAGQLACYMYRFVKKKNSYRIEEGKFRRPYAPTLIDVKLVLDNNTILELYTEGYAEHEYANAHF